MSQNAKVFHANVQFAVYNSSKGKGKHPRMVTFRFWQPDALPIGLLLHDKKLAVGIMGSCVTAT